MNLNFKILFCFLLASSLGISQKVGLVLSGGGAYGLAHIGVIKALEENNIPIDYITGTSAGAIIGSMYAAGYSPEEMEHVVQQDEFINMTAGVMEAKYNYYFKKPSIDASWIRLRISKEFNLNKSIPTNFTNSTMADFNFLSAYSAVSAKANYNFDSLFIPFRCVSSDIVEKKPYIFKEGHLNQAVRASMTYPGYFKPINVDGRLMFDGGLYNNFPTEVMYDEFMPDIIIGVNFSDTLQKPDQDDVISQIKSMIIHRDDLALPCKNGVIITPDFQVGLFDFSNPLYAIEKGYTSTLTLMDSIKKLTNRRVNKEKLQLKRKDYKSDFDSVIINKVQIHGLKGKKELFARKAILKNDEEININQLKIKYFRLFEDERVSFLYPLLTKDKISGKYNLDLDVKPEKPISAEFGGVFSSKPINTGFIGFNYLNLSEVPIKLEVNSYFGKFYGSVFGAMEADAYNPFRLRMKVFGAINRWDFFRSFATFFEDVKPSYIIENESFAGALLELPVSNRGKFGIKFKTGNYNMQYYQTESFTSIDTADATDLFMNVMNVYYEESSLNRKQFPNKGMFFSFRGQLVNNIENSIPGSTSPLVTPALNNYHQWYSLHGRFEKYFNITKYYSIGAEMELHWQWVSNFLDNYTATMITAPSYQPVLESKTLFLPEHSGHDIMGVGLKNIFHINSTIDLRIESYLLQHYTKILSSSYNIPYYDLTNPFKNRYYVLSSALVYESPIGPISAILNYMNARENPWSFMFNFGYLIFNERLMK